ncbi:MAG: hypothetical protein AB7J40_01320 [Candidatus Altimarinota bacterium]
MNIQEALEAYSRDATIPAQESHPPEMNLWKYLTDHKMKLSEILRFLSKSGEDDLRKAIDENITTPVKAINAEVYQRIMVLLSFLYQSGNDLESILRTLQSTKDGDPGNTTTRLLREAREIAEQTKADTHKKRKSL